MSAVFRSHSTGEQTIADGASQASATRPDPRQSEQVPPKFAGTRAMFRSIWVSDTDPTCIGACQLARGAGSYATGRSRRRVMGSCRLRVACAAAAPIVLAACEQQNQYVPPPPPRVIVAQPQKQEVTHYLEATGHTAAVNSTNLVARVQGFLQEIKYRDGDTVKQGATLFVIEPEPFRLKYEQAMQAQAAAEATQKQAEADYQRQVDLASRQIASKAQLDTATANRDAGLAKIKQAEVDTKTARINLDYTEVKAPFDGIVTAHQVSIG